MFNPTPPADCSRGAPLGRFGSDDAATITPDSAPFYLSRVRLDSGGYDDGGAYWGHGAPLYAWQWSDDSADVSGYTRANSREAAKGKVREFYPSARFFR